MARMDTNEEKLFVLIREHSMTKKMMIFLCCLLSTVSQSEHREGAVGRICRRGG
jgi:hypothetical protein